MKAILKARQAALLLISVAVLLASGAPKVGGQSVRDGFDPNANGAINVVVVQSDGRILVGGDFTTLAPNGGPTVARNRIARLNPDGTVDAVFNPNANGSVSTIAIQADGKILVGGSFSGPNSIGGQPRNYIARLEPLTGSADSFDPNANNAVRAIVVQSDGKILVGGLFGGASSIGGQPRNRIARLDSTTGLADSFNPNANLQNVLAIAVQSNGKILVGGFFTNIGGQARNFIARLDPTTGLADSFNPNANDLVLSIAVQPDGKVLAGGNFTNIGGQTRRHIARLDAATGAPDSFNPSANSGLTAIVVQADGKILAGGNFSGANSIGGQTRNNIARLDPATGLADSFDPNVNGGVYTIAVQADGKILAGGAFTTLAPSGGAAVTRNNIARLEAGGRLDQTLSLSATGTQISATAIQPDGKILIGGSFSSILGVSRNNIARLNPDGTLDTAFNPDASNGVNSIAVQADGKILVGGGFTAIGGQMRNYVARLDGGTGAADSFNPNANNSVNSIAVQADGKILVGGSFMVIGGEVRNRIARLDPTGFPDSFDPNANQPVYTMAVQADGKILAGGLFTNIGGQTRNRIARLDATTGAADSFDPNANEAVYAMAVQADGRILAGGSFTSIGEQMRNRIARLDATTGAADSFNPDSNDTVFSVAVQADGKILAGGFFTVMAAPRNYLARLDATGVADSFNPNPNNYVASIAVQPDGKILAGGAFAIIGGLARNFFARLTNDTIAQQNLAVTQSSVTWTRAGSSPQFARVSFEYSTDNVSYTPLGDGTAAGSNWTLTGLSLLTGQNIYVRAHGYYRSGYLNSSESIAESVRNVFLLPPPTPTMVVSRKIHGGAGTFDINLPLTGNSGVECRSGGATNDYQLVFTFPSAVTFTGAAVSAGAGTVSSSSGSGTTAVTVDLTGVSNAQRITVILQGTSDGTGTGDLSVTMGVLVGDTTGNGTVNASDVSLTKLKSGQAVDSSNFRSDININGSINASDVSSVKLKSGTALP